MEYTTQMDAARKGIITKEMEIAAKKEQMDVNEMRELVAKGQVIIPCNKLHTSLDPNAIGSMLKTKINVNLGISRDCKDMDMEIEKVNNAVKMGAESIMDLSSYGDTRTFRKRLTKECPAIIGTVPIYDAVVYYHKPLKEITSQEWLDIVRMHAEDGVDFMTIHCGINKATAGRFKANRRLTNIVSRGGSIIFAWMEMTGEENPFYEHYDEILDICREYDITMSLGDACRPGCIKDASDISQIEELVTLGELTKRAWEKDVQVMVEGPGHMPLNQIAANMEIQKTICQGAPFYVLGPLVTDIAPGYDHITAAIGGAVAAASGASFLCYVTPAEHLRLLNLDDAKALVANGCFAVAEGANMPTTLEATQYLQENGVLFCPGKASNAGGVATSALEMSQNSERLSWTFEEVDAKLKTIMVNIYHNIDDAAKRYNVEGNYVAGANIAGFEKVVNAMLAQGVC